MGSRRVAFFIGLKQESANRSSIRTLPIITAERRTSQTVIACGSDAGDSSISRRLPSE